MNKEKLDLARKNAEKAMEYYTDQFSRKFSEVRIRNESQSIFGVLKFIDYLDSKLAEFESTETPKRRPTTKGDK